MCEIQAALCVFESAQTIDNEKVLQLRYRIAQLSLQSSLILQASRLDKSTISVTYPLATGAEAVSAAFSTTALTAGARLVASAPPPDGQREQARSALATTTGGMPPLSDGRTRVRPVAARCHRAEWTVSCDFPSVVRNDSRTATLVRFEHPRTGRRPLLPILALSRLRRRGRRAPTTTVAPAQAGA